MSDRRVILFGADGLRPDAVGAELMPTYCRLIEEGTRFGEFYAAFPTHTRVNMATLTTGRRPGRHGVVNNVMHVPGAAPDGLVDTSDEARLRSFESATGQAFLLAPTLGDRLHAAGRRLAVAASSSPGASLLWNLRQPRRVVNPASHYGEADLVALLDKLGPVAAERGRTRYESSRWATRAFIDLHLPDPANQVMTLWLTEPDASQHFYGLGSPENHEALRVVDACLAELLEALERSGERDDVDLLLLSDHGHSSVAAARSLAEHLADARTELGVGDGFVAVGDWVYAGASSYDRDELAALAGWCRRQPWCDLLFTTGELDGMPDTFALELATGPIEHDRGPLFCVSPTWSEARNAFGVPGTVDSLTSYAPLRSTHGTASPFDMRALLVGHGPSFAAGAVSDVPCGTVDVAPTVWALLGHQADDFDGRSLLAGAAGEPEVVRRRLVASAGSSRVDVATVAGRAYFLGSAAP